MVDAGILDPAKVTRTALQNATSVASTFLTTEACVANIKEETPAAPAGAAGAVAVTAPMPGKILGVKASAGQAVKRGQVLLILEAMKMENEIVAPQDGTVATINVAVGDSVEPGATLATLN